MSTMALTLQMRLVKALEILLDKVYVPVSKTDIIILQVQATYSQILSLGSYMLCFF